MTQTKKLVIAFCIFLLILVNLGAIAFAALPFLRGNSIQLGLRLLPETKTAVTDADIEKSIVIIRTRLEKLNGNAVLVERSKVPGEEIVVRIPATMDAATVKEVIVEPGRLELKLVVRETQTPYASQEDAEKALKVYGDSESEILPYNTSFKEEDRMVGFIVVKKKPVITSLDFRDARAISSQYNTWNFQIDFFLRPEGAYRMSKATRENTGSSLAIVFNNEVRSAPRIDGEILDRGQITGAFTRLEAEKMAIALNSGELPHEISIVSEKVIPITERIKEKGVRVGVFGFTLLFLFGGFFYVVTR